MNFWANPIYKEQTSGAIFTKTQTKSTALIQTRDGGIRDQGGGSDGDKGSQLPEQLESRASGVC